MAVRWQIMIATMSSEVQHLNESISTCRFAQRVAMIKNQVRAVLTVPHGAVLTVPHGAR